MIQNALALLLAVPLTRHLTLFGWAPLGCI